MVLALFAAALGLIAGVAVTYSWLYDEPPNFTHRAAKVVPIKTVVVRPADDEGKSGSVRGIMGQRFFERPVNLEATTPADQQLRFRFTAPAEILSLDLSVDVNDPRMTLAEFAVGVNAVRGWGWDGQEFDRSADWLLMASWSDNPRSPGSIDETVRLPGVTVAAGDFVGLYAWLGGNGTGGPLRVSPELIILYRWL